MAAIRIEMQQGWSDCDCCGSYSWEKAVVMKDGETILEHRGDTHMGGGEWSEWDHALKAILPLLGHTLEVETTYEND